MELLPSIEYAARVHGLPANPIRGTLFCKACLIERTASTYGKSLSNDFVSESSSTSKTVTLANPPTAAEIADAVWDEPTSGHSSSNTFGWILDKRISTRARVSDMPSINGIAEAVWFFDMNEKIKEGEAGRLLQDIHARRADYSPILLSVEEVQAHVTNELKNFADFLQGDEIADLKSVISDLKRIRQRGENVTHHVEKDKQGRPVSILSTVYDAPDLMNEVEAYLTKIMYNKDSEIKERRRQ